MHDTFAPTCVYASEIDESSGVTTWSKDGCELKEIRKVEQTVVCQCNHLSRFTAGEEIETVKIEYNIIAKVEKSSDELNYSSFPIMLIFVGILLFAIISTSIYDKYKV